MRVEQIVWSRISVSDAMAESPLQSFSPIGQIEELSVRDATGVGLHEVPGFLRGSFTNAGIRAKPSVELGGTGFLGTQDEVIREITEDA